ncbi:hypothetical protein BJV74DRAFT_799593 [Russula compacta]|nr:hypothetical protein BJV74DRAFT_799593 [Russula compacta]
MSRLPPTTPRIRSAERIGRGASSSESQHWHWRSPSSFIHILDDDSLLNIFYLYRPVLLNEDEDGDVLILQGGRWDRERWWYRLTHVCRRWRYLVLASASYLGLCLICTYDTPVADMLAHSPPLPLTIDYIDKDRNITAQDEEGIMLALQHRDRVRRIRLMMPISDLQMLITDMDDEFSMLEYMYIGPTMSHYTSLILPKTFQAPQLRHLMLFDFAFPAGSMLLTTAVGLVTFSLQMIPPSVYFHPNDLLQWLSLMPQLEVLGIDFHTPVPNHEVELQLLHTPITTHVTLPNLRWLALGAVGAYLEALLPRMTTPLLNKLQIAFVDQLTFSVLHLLEFLGTAKNLRFRSASVGFWDQGFDIEVYPYTGAKMYTLSIEVVCEPLDWQVASATQILNGLKTVFSVVEYLTLQYRRPSMPLELERQNEAEHTEWRELLRSFSNVKTLRVDIDLVTQLSRSLRIHDGESAMDLFPELKKLSYPAGANVGDGFAAFIDSREQAGHPVVLAQH